MPFGIPPAYTLHPLYPLRRFLIINAILGAILCLLADEYRYFQWIWPLGIYTMVFSAGIALADLLIFQRRKKEVDSDRSGQVTTPICPQCRIPVTWLHHNDLHSPPEPCGTHERVNYQEEHPIWPIGWIVVLDFLAMLVFCLVWTLEIIAFSAWSSYQYTSAPTKLAQAYASIATLFAIYLHFRCWWKAFRISQIRQWKKEEAQIEAGSRKHRAGVHDHAHCYCSCSAHPSTGPPSEEVLNSSGPTITRDQTREAYQAITPKSWLGRDTMDSARHDHSWNDREGRETQPLLSQHHTHIPSQPTATTLAHLHADPNCASCAHCHACTCTCTGYSNHTNVKLPRSNTENVSLSPGGTDGAQLHLHHHTLSGNVATKQSCTDATITDKATIVGRPLVFTPSATSGTKTEILIDGTGHQPIYSEASEHKSGSVSGGYGGIAAMIGPEHDNDEDGKNTSIMVKKEGKGKSVIGRESASRDEGLD